MITIETQVYTVKDIQDILQISKNAAYQLVQSRSFPVIRIGKLYRVSKEVFEQWLMHT